MMITCIETAIVPLVKYGCTSFYPSAVDILNIMNTEHATRLESQLLSNVPLVQSNNTMHGGCVSNLLSCTVLQVDHEYLMSVSAFSIA